jgi:hypothetical protein
LTDTSSVADPHHVDADPDPACPVDADPDSRFHFNANPDPDHSFQRKAQNLEKVQICKMMRIVKSWIRIRIEIIKLDSDP